ncbi:MFS transporter [Agrilactobacillus fermenti]|uniref:MFS transporter n=1 Tax=Agrilactobacillus fermenti TaxID=2586909 RepID=UPI0022A8DAE1|nr:MFS transporter [Agrilactobacillus fermenti]
MIAEDKPVSQLSSRKLLTVAGFAWLFDAMDVGMLSFILTALQREWHLSAVQLGWLGSISAIGMAVGATVFGALADKAGRRNILLVTLLIFSIGNGISAFVGSLTLFAVLRFFVGAGLGGELPVASALVSENVAVEKRGRYIVLLESFWAGGWLIASILSYFVIPRYGWRVALLGTMITAVYGLLMRIHLRHANDPVKSVTTDTKQTWWQKMAAIWTGQYTKRTVMLWLLWFMIVFSYYGIFLWLPSVMVVRGFDIVHSFGYVLIMTLAQLPGYFMAAWLIEKIGRKGVLVTFLIGTAISAALFGNASSTAMLVFWGALMSFFDLGAWGATYAYSPEQYPSEIRGTGTGMAAAFGRIGGIVGSLLVGYLLTAKVSITWIFIIFAASLIVGALAVLFLGEETKGKTID